MNIQKKDEKYIWHPYTHQKNRIPAICIAKGEKTKLIDIAGKTYIDAVSSWWVNTHGHGNKYIAKKIFEQATRLEQVIFTQFTHEPAVLLAEKLLKKLPGNFEKVFYSDNGSTATEVALKMAIQYWDNKGDRKRKKILVFHHSYHGDTFGAMSISERGIYTFAFRDKLFEVVFMDTPDRKNLPRLKKEVATCSEEIAAFIYEPLLQGAGGMRIYEPAPLDELLQFLKKKKIICIADEVLTGFYRTGKLFAGDHLSTKADIICLSKGLTGGTMALGVTAASPEIYQAFVSDDTTRTLFHGHSFTANPIACTAALASLELTLKRSCGEAVHKIAASHSRFFKKIMIYQQHGIIKNLRQLGTILAFEICNSQTDDYLNTISRDFTLFSMKRGVYLRPMGNTVYILPPYCITRQELKQVYQVILAFLEKISAA